MAETGVAVSLAAPRDRGAWLGAAPDQRPETGDELVERERLREVVVGADLEADDLVDVLVARSQHEDRNVRALADSPAQLDAVSVREIEVEDDQRRDFGRDLRDCRL